MTDNEPISITHHDGVIEVITPIENGRYEIMVSFGDTSIIQFAHGLAMALNEAKLISDELRAEAKEAEEANRADTVL